MEGSGFVQNNDGSGSRRPINILIIRDPDPQHLYRARADFSATIEEKLCYLRRIYVLPVPGSLNLQLTVLIYCVT